MSQEDISFLCIAAHALPDAKLLNDYVPWYQHGAYNVRWAARKKAEWHVDTHKLCVAQIGTSGITVLPLTQTTLTERDAYHTIAYDFWFRNNPGQWSTVARYYGLTIATSPERDVDRAKDLVRHGHYDTALLALDRAILALVEHATITPAIEKMDRKFRGAVNLFLDQPTKPEGRTAARTAFTLGQKCYALLAQAHAAHDTHNTTH